MATVRTTDQTPGRRRRSESKRAAILNAAETLFVTDGYELTSVDAIAARAGVSKRTVYDHFGDKQTLFQGVLVRVNDALVTTVRAAIDQELTDGRDLREALRAFALRVVTEAFPSSAYVTFRRLTSPGRSTPRLPEPARDQPERMLEERFEKFAADGEIRAADPGRAAMHFTALTIRLVLEEFKDADGDAGAQTNAGAQAGAGAATAPEILAIIDDGVDAFLRAYAPGS